MLSSIVYFFLNPIGFSFKRRNSSETVFNILFITDLNNLPKQLKTVRDRPFNLKGGGGLCFFVSFRIFFSDNTRVRILIFFQNLTLGYMTKTLNQIIFFSSTKIRIFFSATLGIRIFC